MTTFTLSEEKKDKKFSRSRVYTSVLKGWKLTLGFWILQICSIYKEGTRRCSVKMVYLTVSKNSQKNTRVRGSYQKSSRLKTD